MADPATTGLALSALLNHARDLRVDPFDKIDYAYAQDVIDGFDYLFLIWLAKDDTGIHIPPLYNFYVPEVYTIGIIMMAIAASNAPDRVVTTGALTNSTYQEVLQGMLDWMAYAQNTDGCAIGGWAYVAPEMLGSEWADNSNSGYATLGMGLAAAAPPDGFGLAVPDSVLASLPTFITNIQVPSDVEDLDLLPYVGGSIYNPCPYPPWTTPPVPPGEPYDTMVNILKAGNLLYELALVGDIINADRVQDALGFIGEYWDRWAGTDDGSGWKGDYQAMFTLMKGLRAYGKTTLKIKVSGIYKDINWFYDEFNGVARYIVDTQIDDDPNFYGAWKHIHGEGTPATLDTAWALLVLERAVPKVPIFGFEIPDQCVVSGESFEDINADASVDEGTLPYSWTLEGNEDLSVAEYTVNVFTITYSEDWTGSETIAFRLTDGVEKTYEDTTTFTVDPELAVNNIPDKTAPFMLFNLDDHLANPAPTGVSWSYSDTCLDVSIDENNMVTITPPEEGCTEPQPIIFNATAMVCGEEVSKSDAATFTLNQPPDCMGAAPNIETIWPPNHKFVAINVIGVTDPDGDPVEITIDSIYQDEPVDTFGDGRFAPDGKGVGTDTAEVRAERSGTKKVPGNGRVYHIGFTADDGNGGACTGEVLVGVPHDRGKGKVPVDDGALHDSTVVP